ncbi:autotransporter outer membrane beta-barrel domain-containing protein [Sphingomonas sp.]|uniref:autotransporter outer membrane beta-barrel domain-containing protein n=1 Tax=Sphingomonas sp. TaxID=28214 RepID=UPI002FCAD111
MLGAGACDTSFSVGELTTSGDGSTGALVRSAGGTTGSIGVLRTEGDDAAGVDIATDPAACLILGAGACDVGLVADDVSTGGDGAAGVLIASTGGVVTDLGRVATAGDDSAGIAIVQDPAACLAIGPGACRVQAEADDVDTGGDNSPGVVVESPGPIDVDAGEVTTGGDDSDAIHVEGGDEPVTVTAGAIVTTGDDSDGVEVVTVNGDQTLNVGPIRVSGLGSDAVVATSVCGDIGINVRDDIVSVQGNAIIASTGCGVEVTTAPGADVAGATGGVLLTSGTGALLDIGGSVTAAAGPAIDVDGAAAEVIIRPTGSVAGAIDLTPNDDSLVNAGLFAPVGTSDFGAGADLFANDGQLRVRGTAALQGLELLANNGSVDLADGAADDRLIVSGDFTGGAGSTLLLDVAAGTAGTPADGLVVGGNAGGTTAIELNLLGNVAVANPAGVVLVDAQTATSGAFTLEGPTRAGLVDYSLRQQGGDILLVALPNAFAVEPLLAGRMGLDFWYQSADAWSESAAPRRANLTADRPGMSFWVQGYGSTEESGERRDIDVFGTSSPADLRFDTDRRGVQAGIDFRTGAGFAFGITGGYQHAASELAGSEFDLEGHNIGAYLLYGQSSGLYAELLAKADFFDVRLRNGALFLGAEPEGKSYGVEGELGYRTAFGGFDLDLGAGLAYVSTDLDGFEASGFRYEYDDAKSLRGRLGFRASASGSGLAPYLDAKVLHEFNGDNDTVLSSGGFDLELADRGKRTWGRGELGLAGSTNGSGGFVALWGEIGDVEGYGLRLGFRF